MDHSIEIINKKTELAIAEISCLLKEKEALSLLSNEFPAIRKMLSNETLADIYKVVSAFAGFTKEHARNQDLKEVKHCFNVAEKMLHEGNSAVKNAIENVYVFSLSSLLDVPSAMSSRIRELLNASLKNEYYRQVSASGI